MNSNEYTNMHKMGKEMRAHAGVVKREWRFDHSTKKFRHKTYGSKGFYGDKTYDSIMFRYGGETHYFPYAEYDEDPSGFGFQFRTRANGNYYVASNKWLSLASTRAGRKQIREANRRLRAIKLRAQRTTKDPENWKY